MWTDKEIHVSQKWLDFAPTQLNINEPVDLRQNFNDFCRRIPKNAICGMKHRFLVRLQHFQQILAGHPSKGNNCVAEAKKQLRDSKVY